MARKEIFYDVEKFFDHIKGEIVIDGLPAKDADTGIVLARIDVKDGELRYEDAEAPLCSNTLKAIGECYIILAENRIEELKS